MIVLTNIFKRVARMFRRELSHEEWLKENGYELRGDEIYFQGVKVGSVYQENDK